MLVDFSSYLNNSKFLFPLNQYNLAPAFWNFIIETTKSGRVLSIDRVYDEIQNGKDELAVWVKNNISYSFKDLTNDEKLIDNYGKIIQWAASQTQFSQAAINEFARVENADAWIVSFAKTMDYKVVTHEVFNLNIKKKVPIPNVCNAFDVKYIDTFKLLREFNFKFK